MKTHFHGRFSKRSSKKRKRRNQRSIRYNGAKSDMQRLRIASLLCLFALSSTAFTGVAPAQTPSVAQKLTSAMIEALGGQAFLDVKEIQTNGRFFSFRRGEVSGAQIYADFVKFPDMERTEFGKEKEKTIKINKGDEGWLVSGKDEK